MNTFKRGITDVKFIAALNDLYEVPNSFWHKMIIDPKLFIAIRDEYISVYYSGNCICELHFKEPKIIGKTHYKYLLHPDLKVQHIESSGGVFSLNDPLLKFISSLDEFNLIKKASLVYSGKEKKGVHSISIKEKNILDVEVAFTQGDIRIDYLELQENDKKLELVFHEAKHFSNKEIRAENEDPKVLKQLKKYEAALKINKEEIKKSYAVICKNLQELHLTKPNKDELIIRVANGEDFSIDDKIRLIIFGFDQDQKDGKFWKKHHEKLKESLGDRLILKGDVNS